MEGAVLALVQRADSPFRLLRVMMRGVMVERRSRVKNGEEVKDRIARHLSFKKPQMRKNTSKRYK